VNLGVDLRRVCHGLSDFSPKENSIALAKAVDCDLQGSFGGAQLAGEFTVRNFALTEEENLEPFEVARTAVLRELVPESRDGAIEQREGPTAFEDAFRRIAIERFEPVPLLAGGDLKGQNGARPALLGTFAIRLIGEEVFALVHKKGAEARAIRIGAVEVTAFEYADEEVLGKVLRLGIAVPSSAHVRVNGIPVVFAQARQGVTAILTQWISGIRHQGPTGGGKFVASDLRVRCHSAPSRCG
jgi:hypothetical protein